MRKNHLIALGILAALFAACAEATPTPGSKPTEAPVAEATEAPAATEPAASGPAEPVAMPSEGTENCDITVFQDIAQHWAYTGMPIIKDLTFVYDSQTAILRIDGTFPWVAVEGPLNTTKNSFIGTGVGTVAEYPDVTVSAEGSVSNNPAGDGLIDLTFKYTLGVGGELPQQEPIIFDFVCKAKSQ